MDYIKGIEIISTPKLIEIDGVTLELSDEQLRELGYTPIDEVFIAQAEILSSMAPSAEIIKQRVMDKLSVTVPSSGLPYMIGFRWDTTIVDDEIRFKLVPDSNGLGTKNNPILFYMYVLLVPNAHYLYDGNIYKYKGAKRSVDNWDDCKDEMELV